MKVASYYKKLQNNIPEQRLKLGGKPFKANEQTLTAGTPSKVYDIEKALRWWASAGYVKSISGGAFTVKLSLESPDEYTDPVVVGVKTGETLDLGIFGNIARIRFDRVSIDATLSYVLI